jgi:predicted DNA-binding protein YlxM (UPF0122 family)
VELLTAYSNPDIVSRLQRILAGEGSDQLPDRSPRSRQHQHRLTTEQVDQLVERYQAGESSNRLAAEFEVHRTTISTNLAARNVRTRYRLLDDDLAGATRLYESGWSLARVAKQFGVSPGTILNCFKRAGVATRPVGTNQWPARL